MSIFTKANDPRRDALFQVYAVFQRRLDNYRQIAIAAFPIMFAVGTFFVSIVHENKDDIGCRGALILASTIAGFYFLAGYGFCKLQENFKDISSVVLSIEKLMEFHKDDAYLEGKPLFSGSGFESQRVDSDDPGVWEDFYIRGAVWLSILLAIVFATAVALVA